MGHASELFKLRRTHVTVTQHAHGSLIVNGVAVVRGREDRDAPPAVLHHIPLVLHLMASNANLQVVGFQKGPGDIGTKRLPHSPFRRGAAREGLGVAPQKVTHESPLLVRLLKPPYALYVLQRHPVRAEEPPVGYHNPPLLPLPADHCRKRQGLKHGRKEFHGPGAVLVSHLALKPIHLVLKLGLMVASGEMNVIGVEELPRTQKQHVFHPPRPPVAKVAIEQIFW